MVNFEKIISLFLLVVVLTFFLGCDEDTQVKMKSVSVDDNHIIINADGDILGTKVLVLRSFEDVDHDNIKSESVYNLDGKGMIKRFQNGRDLIYSKFCLLDKDNNLIDGPMYVSDTSGISVSNKPLLMPDSIKGLTCIVDIADAVELGVKHVNENIYIRQFIDYAESDCVYYQFEDVKIPLKKSTIKEYDNRLREFYENGIGVSIVFVNQMPNERIEDDPTIHPNSDVEGSPTHIGAFNVVEPLGLKYYLGLLEFICERYTRDDAKYGQIYMLIVGNEIQQHWVWHNMGRVPQERVIDEYVESVRLAWLASQKFHEDLKIFISMEHHWTAKMTGNPLQEIQGDHLLEGIVAKCKQEGDFPWNVAFHPYPENLFEPRFWNDIKPTFEFDTPFITFKNLEVLPRYMSQEKMCYKGSPRSIALTEQGFHSPPGIDGEKIQAAAYAYSYVKVSKIPEISSFMLHRHVDHRGEGGLKLGLWTWDPNAPSPCVPLKKKFAWDVFKAAGTERQDEAFAFAKEIIGIDDWNDDPPVVDIKIESPFQVEQDQIVFDFIDKFYQGKSENNLNCLKKDVFRAAGWLAPAIHQHPPGNGNGNLNFNIKLPEQTDLALLFEMLLTGDSSDGVKFFIEVDGKEIWSCVYKSLEPKSVKIDLSAYQGKQVVLTFGVNKVEELAFDWANWVQPIIIRVK